jgi:hypothetical protein
MKSLLLSALLFLCASCGAFLNTPADGGLRQQLIETLTLAGDVAVRMEGTRLLDEHAPGLKQYIDKPEVVDGVTVPKDGQVSLAEFVKFIEQATPAQIVMLGAIYFRD